VCEGGDNMDESQRRCRQVGAPSAESPCGRGLLAKLDEDTPTDKVRAAQTGEAYGR